MRSARRHEIREESTNNQYMRVAQYVLWMDIYIKNSAIKAQQFQEDQN